jgi:hypothetical protein
VSHYGIAADVSIFPFRKSSDLRATYVDHVGLSGSYLLTAASRSRVPACDSAIAAVPGVNRRISEASMSIRIDSLSVVDPAILLPRHQSNVAFFRGTTSGVARRITKNCGGLLMRDQHKKQRDVRSYQGEVESTFKDAAGPD